MKNILLGVTASISAYKACDIITDLREKGFNITVVMTKDAQNFITPLSLQSFSGNEVIGDFFSLPGRVKPVHIELAKKSDLILIAPASADILAKISYGFADDVLTCAVLASEAFFPFRDSVDVAAMAGVTAIVQPGGSKNDQESIDAANQHGIAMVFTGVRHFRH